MKKDNSAEAGDPNSWEAADLKVKKPSSAVVSVRMPAELLIALETYADARSVSISDIVRLASERLLKGTEQQPTFALVATAPTPALKLAGPTVLVHALTAGANPVWLREPPTYSETATGVPYRAV